MGPGFTFKVIQFNKKNKKNNDPHRTQVKGVGTDSGYGNIEKKVPLTLTAPVGGARKHRP
jgi:hypothetical protein